MLDVGCWMLDWMSVGGVKGLRFEKKPCTTEKNDWQEDTFYIQT